MVSCAVDKPPSLNDLAADLAGSLVALQAAISTADAESRVSRGDDDDLGSFAAGRRHAAAAILCEIYRAIPGIDPDPARVVDLSRDFDFDGEDADA